MKVNTYFVGWMEGLAQSLDIDDGSVTYNFYSTMGVSLNNSLSYEIIIMDPKIQIFSGIPQSFITRISIMNEYVGALQVYLKVHCTCRQKEKEEGNTIMSLVLNFLGIIVFFRQLDTRN